MNRTIAEMMEKFMFGYRKAVAGGDGDQRTDWGRLKPVCFQNRAPALFYITGNSVNAASVLALQVSVRIHHKMHVPS